MARTDPILLKARQLAFHYDEDLAALQEIKRRLAAVGRREDVIAYSDLVEGIVFKLPTVQSGKPIVLGIPEWSGLHQAIIGGCLGRISCDTYKQGRFLASAVAVSKATQEPSEGFRALLEDLGFVKSRRDLPRCLEIWLSEFKKAHIWLCEHVSWPDD